MGLCWAWQQQGRIIHIERFYIFQPGSVDGTEDDSYLGSTKVIVFMSSLLSLLSVCREPNCGSVVDRENMKIVHNGAMIRVHMVCNNNHATAWESSPCISNGKKSVAVINIIIATYCLLTGLHVKQANDR